MISDLAMQRAIDRYHRAGLAGMNDEERTLATIWYFESKVANGGFEHFFTSREGELAPGAPAAFRAIGSDVLAGIAERANATFGVGGVPGDRRQREQAIREMPESMRQSFDVLENEYLERAPDLDGRVEAYLLHRSPAAERS